MATGQLFSIESGDASGNSSGRADFRSRLAQIRLQVLRFLEEEMFIKLTRYGWDGRGRPKDDQPTRSMVRRERAKVRKRDAAPLRIPDTAEWLARKEQQPLPDGTPAKRWVLDDTPRPSVAGDESSLPAFRPRRKGEAANGAANGTEPLAFQATSNSITVPPLTSLKQLEAWAAAYLPPDRIHLTKKAIKAAALSDYRDPELVGQSLLLIANEYRDYLYGRDPNRRERFIRRRDELRVIIGSTFTTTVPRHRPATYEVTMPWDGSRKYLDMHLVRGKNRDPRSDLRIYFHAENANRPIVVGYLPDHLPNSLS